MKGDEIPPYEYSLLTKDGRRITAINTTKIIDFEGEKAILGIITDITECKQAEKKLKRKGRRTRKVAETYNGQRGKDD